MNKVVVVWRDSWLPYSQTFVFDHVRSLLRYISLPAGLAVTHEEYKSVVAYSSSAKGKMSRAQKLRFGSFGFRSFVKFLENKNITLIHAHFGPGGIRMLPVARALNVPLVVTFHGSDVLSLPLRRVRGALYKRRLRRLFAHADLLLPVSDFLRQELIRLGAPSYKVQTHYLGTSVVVPERCAGFSERTGILFVGRLVPSKGAAELLTAVATHPRLKTVPVTIVGEGPEMETLRRMTHEHGLNVHFAGVQPHYRVVELMDSHRVFCLPSHREAGSGPEAFGLVFAEAAMRGLPSCAFSEGGVPEVIQHQETGLLSVSGDVRELSDQLMTLYHDQELWSAYSSRAIETAKERFTLSTQNERLEELYDNTVR